MSRFLAYRNAAWTSGTAGSQTVVLDTMEYAVDATLASGVVTVARAGLWYIEATVGYHPNTGASEAQAIVQVTGASQLRQRSHVSNSTTGFNTPVAGPVSLVAGDTLTLILARSSPVDGSAYTGRSETRMSGFLVESA